MLQGANKKISDEHSNASRVQTKKYLVKLFHGFYTVDFVERIFPLQRAKELQLQHLRKRKN